MSPLEAQGWFPCDLMPWFREQPRSASLMIPNLCRPGQPHHGVLGNRASTSSTAETPSAGGYTSHLSPPRAPSQPPLSATPSATHQSFGSPRIGHLWNSRGAASYHGSSYFGHQSAASLVQIESPELPAGMNGIHANAASRSRPPDNLVHHGGKEPYAHIWELVGCLPRRKTVVDHLVNRFFDELNPVYDSVHKETFQVSYDAFWDRKWGDDDLTAVDLRWLALLFMMLAFAELLDCPLDTTVDGQRACEESSVQFFWASRKAIVLAPTISGESPDLVRAGILVSRYLIFFGRKTESWLTSSFAIRMAQAQGMHLDGESWRLPPKVLETRRRLWCILFSLDRSLSLTTGRPYTINSKHCMLMKIRNIWIDDMSNEEAAEAIEKPPSDPTRTIYYSYQQRMSTILGDIHDDCFSLEPTTTSYSTYEKVLQLDRVLLDWADSLPPYFRIEQTDTSLDATHPFLLWQRMYLHSLYHFARVTLHRSYVLLESITGRFQYSRDACISSACADLRLKLTFRPTSMADRLKAGGAMHNLFNSALVLGVIAVRDPHSPRTRGILEDLAAYCEKQRADIWVKQFALAEVKVIELCIATARKTSREGQPHNLNHQPVEPVGRSSEEFPNFQRTGPFPQSLTLMGPSSGEMGGTHLGMASARTQMGVPTVAQNSLPGIEHTGNGVDQGETWLDSWFGPTRNFPEPLDFQFWEDLVGTLDSR
uniref:Xylanolytic transcriptional activator regulatory domain-containing protein n=1 Tax=Bionectria ochroleuca TaxID=29856 RepID=A0A0B7KE57_BIOOC